MDETIYPLRNQGVGIIIMNVKKSLGRLQTNFTGLNTLAAHMHFCCTVLTATESVQTTVVAGLF